MDPDPGGPITRGSGTLVICSAVPGWRLQGDPEPGGERERGAPRGWRQSAVSPSLRPAQVHPASVADQDPSDSYVFGPPESEEWIRIPDPFIIKQISRKNLVSYCFVISFWLFDLQHCRIWGAADEAVLTTVQYIEEKKSRKYLCRESGEEDLDARELLRRGPVSPTCDGSKRRKLATRCNPRWLENPNSSLTQYECGRMKPLLCSRHHRQAK